MRTEHPSRVIATALFSLTLLMGCSAVVSSMVQSQLNMNSSGPDFSIDPAVAALGETERFYAELLADADDELASFKGEPFTPEEKREAVSTFMDAFESNTKRQVERGLVAPDFGDSLVNQFERGFKRGEYVHLSRTAPGAASVGWSKTVQQNTAVNMIATTIGVSFRYPVASKEEGRRVLAQFSALFNRVISDRARWVIQDLDGARANYVKMAGYDTQLAGMGQEGSPYDWDALSAGPISTITFTYRWKSQATLKTTGIETPAIDQVFVSVHNNLEDAQYNYQKIMNGGNQHPGSFVVVAISISTSVNGN